MTKSHSSKLPTNVSDNSFEPGFHQCLQHVFTLIAVGIGLIALTAFTVGQLASLLPSNPVMLLSLGIIICIFEYFLNQKWQVFILHSLFYGAVFGVIFKNDISSFIKIFLPIPLLFLFMATCIRINRPKLSRYKFFFLTGALSCIATFLFGWLCGFSAFQLVFSLLGVIGFTSLSGYKLPRLEALYSYQKVTSPLSKLALTCSLEIYKAFDFLSIFVAFYSGIILIPLLLILGAFSLLKYIKKMQHNSDNSV